MYKCRRLKFTHAGNGPRHFLKDLNIEKSCVFESIRCDTLDYFLCIRTASGRQPARGLGSQPRDGTIRIAWTYGADGNCPSWFSKRWPLAELKLSRASSGWFASPPRSPQRRRSAAMCCRERRCRVPVSDRRCDSLSRLDRAAARRVQISQLQNVDRSETATDFRDFRNPNWTNELL